LKKDEGEILKQLLKEKQEEAFRLDDKILAIGIGFLVAGLIGYRALKD